MEAMPLNLKRPEVPVELAALVAKMMAKEPERRFQEPKEVAQALTPFFKKGTLAFRSPEAEMSRGDRSGPGRPEPGVVTTPPQPVTIDAGPMAQQPSAAPPSASEPQWEILIDRRETERTRDETPTKAPAQRRPRFWPSAAVGVMLLALFVAWATVVRVKTSNGIIELVDLPKDAEVFIDGEEVAVTWPGGGKPAVITVTAGGKHKLTVKKNGLEFSVDEMAVQAEEKAEFTVRFVPLAASPAVKGNADDRPARPRFGGNLPEEGPPDLSLEAADKRGASGSAVGRPASSPVVETTSANDGFRPLFNGKDLAGWITHPSQKDGWRVEDGVLLGSSPPGGILYSERSNFSDFHLRLEARISHGGDSGVFFRSLFGPSLIRENPNWPDGYEVELHSNLLGFLHAWPFGRVSRALKLPAVHGEWFPIEVIAVGNHIVVKIRGKTTVDFTDPNRRYTSGRIAFQKLGPTEVAFRNIQINELSSNAPLPLTVSRETPREPARKPPAAADSTGRPRITNSIGMKLVLIPAGEFVMGSPDSDPVAERDEKPQHPVRISRPFYLGVNEVTQGEFRAVMGTNPSHFGESDDLPVEQVSWLAAVRFCIKLSERENRAPFYRVDGTAVTVVGGGGYRLPTEAEWEYACRAGSTTRFPFGEDAGTLGEYAWYRRNSEGKTHPVGRKLPNAWGLHDMVGNVLEWCDDWYGEMYYASSPRSDPSGPPSASNRVDRGGSFTSIPRYCRSADRAGFAPGHRNDYLGLRLVLVPSGR